MTPMESDYNISLICAHDMSAS